jgi:gamma-glutamylcyclotransferase (GGCT)/AIG2-like uncharacterized protein YtfP
MVERQSIRQMPLKTLEELNKSIRELGLILSPFNEDVRHLWQLGILRADVVVTRDSIDMDGLVFIGSEGDENRYADMRDCVSKTNGLADVVKDLGVLPADIYPLFHPFRYYVVYRIEEELIPRINAFQILKSTTGCRRALDQFIDTIQTRTASEKFRADVRRWNEITSLAVAVEPFTYGKVFGYYKFPDPNFKKEEEFYSDQRAQYEDCKEMLLAIGLDQVKRILSELCRKAAVLEPNDDIRRLLRLTKRYRIERVKGKLGGSVYLLCMAEMIRRTAERVFETELPEEDEIGCGWGEETADFKEDFYGTRRVVDSHKAKRNFLRDLNLDYSVRLRWYVEGYTELNALSAEFSEDENIELINLKGEVHAGTAKGLSFRENLVNDLRQSVYSFISLDRDEENNRRVLDKAIECREMFGMAFLSDPDFEFENFSSDELAHLLWQMALEKGAPIEEEEYFLKVVSSARNGKQLTENERKALPNFQSSAKGKEWGERLLKFAKANPYRERDRQREYRPLLEAILWARHALDCDYYLGREEGRVDVKTRRIVNVRRYFAYGSNLFSARLRARVPSALVRSIGYLQGYTVRYNKKSVDGSGKCNVVRTDENDRVYGVVYDFLVDEQPALDKHEGLGRGYHTEEVRVVTDNGETGAYTYVADELAVDESLRPYSWYKEFVVKGARQHRLPDEYIAQLESVDADADPDGERERLNRESLLGGSTN